MARHSGQNIELTAYDDLFETDESREDRKKERITEIPIKSISGFPEHPYKVIEDDESMRELVESIITHGLLQPVLVRPLEDGSYQMVSGHRRMKAFEIAGIEKIPCRVREMSFDEAVLLMVDSNLQREEILPSEKAFAYKMRLEAMKRQGQRTDLTSTPLGEKLSGKAALSVTAVSNATGESQTQIQRYIRLTYLIPQLLDIVDEKKMKLRPAVEISYLTDEQQYWLLDSIENELATPSHAQAIRIRKLSEEGNLTEDSLDDIMCEEKPNQREKFIIRDEKVFDMFPDDMPMSERQDYVMDALSAYKNVPATVPKEKKNGYVKKAVTFFNKLPENMKEDKMQDFLGNAVKYYQQYLERQKKNKDAR